MQNPTTYTTNASIDDYCMTSTTSTGVYIFGKGKQDAYKQPSANAERIANARENIKPYLKG